MQTSDPGAVGPDEQLARATQVRLEARHLEERIESARKRAGASTADAAAAASTLSDEERDVQRLQSVSWARLLAAVKGSRMTDLERETAERERARYEAGVAAARAQSDLRELESLESQLAALGDVEAAYTAALAAKEEWVRGHDPQVARRLEEIAAERGRVAAEDHEAVEAYDAGVTAHRHLADAAQLLDSARSWSTWDTFGGGGLITDMVKYDKLDQVRDELRRADAALRAFSHELADVHQPAVQALDIGQLSHGVRRLLRQHLQRLGRPRPDRERPRQGAGRGPPHRGCPRRTHPAAQRAGEPADGPGRGTHPTARWLKSDRAGGQFLEAVGRRISPSSRQFPRAPGETDPRT